MNFDWTIILSIGGAFGAASTAQYFSHRLTLKREEEKYKKEKYFKFYSPVVFKMMKYLESEVYDRLGVNKATNPNPEKVFDSIVTIIEQNIIYADYSLIAIYEESKIKKMVEFDEDEKTDKSFHRWIDFRKRLNVIEQFFSDYLEITKELNFLTKDLETEVKQSLAKIKLFNLFDDFFLLDTAEVIFANSDSFIKRDTVDELLNEIQHISWITEDKINTYDKENKTVTEECYLDLFLFLDSLINKMGILGNSTNVIDAVEEDLGIIGYKTNMKINIDNLESIDFKKMSQKKVRT